MATAVTYALLVLDVLVVALLVELIVLGPIWLIRRRRASGSAASTPRETGFGSEAHQRRCNTCRASWVGRPGTDASRLILILRRSARRRARRRKRPTPAWAARQGWGRCPSCFSTNVRDSRRQEAAGTR
jgi:hypothetical protein